MPLNIPRAFVEIVGIMAMVELAVMWVLPIVAPGVEGAFAAVLDASLLAGVAGPVIVWRLIRLQGRSQTVPDLERAPRPWAVVAAPAGVLVIGFAATAIAMVSTSKQAQREAEMRFDQLTDRLVGEASRRLNQPWYGMTGAKGVYVASESVSRGEFAAYVASRDLSKECPGTIGIGFVQRVLRSDLDAFVAGERADSAPEFRIRSLATAESAAGSPADLYVVKHCFPEARNARAWGLDIGSEPVRRAAAERAATTGQPVVSGKVSFELKDETRTGILYLLPVYKRGTSAETPSERLDALAGLICAPLVVEDALAGLVEDARGELALEVIDGPVALQDSAAHGGARILASGCEHGDTGEGVGAGTSPLFRRATPMTIGGRVWTVITSTTPIFNARIDRSTTVILGVGGTILSVLLAGIAWTLWNGRSRVLLLARSMTRDLLTAKIAAERLAEIARRTSNAVVITDPRGCIEWVNEGFTRISGYSLDEVRGKKPGSVLQGRDTDPEMVQRMRNAVREGVSTNAELVNYTKEGRAYVISVELVPLRDSQGTINGFMAIESDITEQKAAELRLQQSNTELAAAREQAEAANKAKSAFLANMSHEIRTPLTAILGFADLLREDGPTGLAFEQRVQAIDTIRHAGTHLLTVINDILDLSKIEADRMTVERIDTPLITVLHEVESLVRPRASAKGLTLSTILETAVPERIMSDPTRLRQILMNLVGNAIKFTESGGVCIRVSATDADEQSVLIIDIEDTGAGMTQDHVARLFQAFGQADETMTRKFGGSGLGLSISRRLAGLMGGDVVLHRTGPGKGSCFRVVLPLEPAAGSATVTALDVVSPDIAPAVSEIRFTGHVLLTEDGVDNQRLIAFHLRRAGARVTVAENGRVALGLIDLAAAAGTPFDLLLTDMQMPEMDGYTLARTLRDRGSTLAIVALTAHAMAEDREKCLSAGCDDFATKPIDKVKLLATCAAWCGKRSTVDERPVPFEGRSSFSAAPNGPTG